MKNIELAVRCLEIEEEISALVYEIKQTEAAIAFSDSDDDQARREEIVQKRAAIATLQNEQVNLNAMMVGPFPLEEAAIAHEKAAKQKPAKV